MPVLHVLCLPKDELALAYPLVQSAVRIELAQWQEFAREMIDGGGGVLGVRMDAECLYGLAAFRPLTTLRHRRALSVELLVAVDLGRRQRVREALLSRLGEIARARACTSLVLTTSTSARERWKERGFVEETASLVRNFLAGDREQSGSTSAARYE